MLDPNGEPVANLYTVTQVIEGSPAEKYVKEGDLILGIDGHLFKTSQSLDVLYGPYQHQNRRGLDMHAGLLVDKAEGAGKITLNLIPAESVEKIQGIQPLWKEAFREIVPADILAKCTDIGRATEMYKQLLEENKGNGYILELEEKPHCMAWWDAARDRDMDGFAELICIHSLKDNWRKGYGKMMMKKVLDDVKRAGYSKIMLWVFDNNIRAIRFYEAFGFAASGRKKPSLGTMEEMYIKTV